jgi:hypothetical protein
VRLQYAGLARGDDPGLERAVDSFVEAHEAEMADPNWSLRWGRRSL